MLKPCINCIKAHFLSLTHPRINIQCKLSEQILYLCKFKLQKSKNWNTIFTIGQRDISHSTLITAPIYWRIEYSFLKRGCAANKKNLAFRYARCKFGLHCLITQGASLRQNIGAANILFVSGRSGFFFCRSGSSLVVPFTANLGI